MGSTDKKTSMNPTQIAAEAAKDFCLRFNVNPDVFLEPLTKAFQSAIEKAYAEGKCDMAETAADMIIERAAHASEAEIAKAYQRGVDSMRTGVAGGDGTEGQSAAHASEEWTIHDPLLAGLGHSEAAAIAAAHNATLSAHASEQGAFSQETLNEILRCYGSATMSPKLDESIPIAAQGTTAIITALVASLSQRPTPATASEPYIGLGHDGTDLPKPESASVSETVQEIADSYPWSKPDSALVGKDSHGCEIFDVPGCLSREMEKERKPDSASVGKGVTAMKKGDKVYVLGTGSYGVLTHITKSGIGWVKVRSRWGSHHHPVTPKTFRYPLDRIVPEEAANPLKSQTDKP